MPALINNRLAAAFEAIPVESRLPAELALAAYGVMEGAALALGLASTGVAFFKPGAHPAEPLGYVVEWKDGPTEWAESAAVQDEPRHVAIYSSVAGDALVFYGVVA